MAAVTGAAGAVCRYLLAGAVQSASRSGFPIGTLTVNLTGALLIGLVAGVGDGSSSASSSGNPTATTADPSIRR
jgi:CrcB protein